MRTPVVCLAFFIFWFTIAASSVQAASTLNFKGVDRAHITVSEESERYAAAAPEHNKATRFQLIHKPQTGSENILASGATSGDKLALASQSYRLADLDQDQHEIFTRETYWIYNSDTQRLEERHADTTLFTFTTSTDAPHVEGTLLWDEAFTLSSSGTIGALTVSSGRTISFEGGGLSSSGETITIDGEFNFTDGQGTDLSISGGSGTVNIDNTHGSLSAMDVNVNVTTCDYQSLGVSSDDVQVIDTLVHGTTTIIAKAFSITDSEFHGNMLIDSGSGSCSFTGNTVYRDIQFKKHDGGNPTVSDCTFFRAVKVPHGADYSSARITLSNCNYGLNDPRSDEGMVWLKEKFGGVVDSYNFTVQGLKANPVLKPCSITSDRPLPELEYSSASGQGTLPSVPIQDRDTLVAIRLWAPIEGSASATYSLEFNGETFQPVNPGYTISMDTTVSNGKTNGGESLNFIIPARLANTASVDWRVVVNPAAPNGYNNPTESAFSGTTHFSRKYARDFVVGIVPVKYDLLFGDPGRPMQYNLALQQLKTKLPACWPISKSQVKIVELPAFTYKSYLSGLHWFTRVYHMTMSLQLYLATYNLTAPTKIDKLVALVPPSSIGGNAGANLGGVAVCLVDSHYVESTLHELGHTLGWYLSTEQYDMATGYYNGEYIRKDDGMILDGITLFNPEGSTDKAVPGRIRHLPHDKLSGVYDIFGTLDPTWTALSTRTNLEFSLGNLLGVEAAPKQIARAAPPLLEEAAVAAGNKRILLRGILGPQDSALQFDPRSITAMDLSDTLTDEVSGGSYLVRYTLRAYDGDGQLLTAQRCYNSDPDTSKVHMWMQSVDLPESLAKLEIVDIVTDKVIWQTTLDTAPQVSLNTPDSSTPITDTIDISWEDANSGRTTSYQLMVRDSGGADWQPLTDFTSTTSVTIPATALPQSNTLEFGVLASNGVAKSLETSSGFTRGNKPPVMSISAPQAGDRADASFEWTMAASGFDPDGDTVTWQWSSDVDGELGTEPTLSNITLSAGTHTLTCTATDADGDATSAQVEVTAGPVTTIDLSIPEDALSASIAGRDPLVREGNQLMPNAESTIALNVRNLGLTNQARLVCTITPPSGSPTTIIDDTFVWDEFDIHSASVRYTPSVVGDYTITATITTNASDPDASNNTRTWVLSNDPPTSPTLRFQAFAGQANAITLEAQDPDSETLTYAVVDQPSLGTLTGTAPNLTYNVPVGTAGADSFTFRASDGTTQSEKITVSLEVVSPDLVHTVSISTTGQGSASPTGTTNVMSGESLSITLTPEDGYEVNRIFVNDIRQDSTASPLVLANVQKDTTVAVYFEASIVDADSDGLEDGWETTYFGNLNQNGSQDSDGDGLTNLQEYDSVFEYDPTKKDTDGDGMPDKWEFDNMLFGDIPDANDDPDNDGATNIEEYRGDSDPWDTDSLPKAGNASMEAVNLLLLN